MSDDPEQSAEFLLRRLANEQETNRKLRALLVRAADTLEKIQKEWPIEELGLEAALIGELRKAAQ